MIEINRTLQASIKNGTTNQQEIEQYVMQFPLSEIVSTCAELLIKYNLDRTPKIVITEDEFNAHFRIAGLKEDGTRERRGRRPKVMETLSLDL